MAKAGMKRPYPKNQFGTKGTPYKAPPKEALNEIPHVEDKTSYGK